MDALRAKSESLTGYLETLLKEYCGDRITILTPSEPSARGCQLSLRLKEGKRVFEKLSASGIVCDWREPDVIRVAPVPFYNRYAEVFDFVERLKGVIDNEG
jgi:kynureninase